MFSHVFSCFLMFSHVSLSSQHVSWICKLQVTCQSVCVGRCRNRDLLGGHTRTQRRTLVSDGFFMPPGQMLAGWLWVWTSRGRSWKSPGFNRQRHAEKRDEKSFRIEKNWEELRRWVMMGPFCLETPFERIQHVKSSQALQCSAASPLI